MKNEIPKLISMETKKPGSIKELLNFVQPFNNEPTLSSFLNQIMKDKNLSAPDVYHMAWLDRQTYSKLISIKNPQRASKHTLLQVCIGIYASEREATELLGTCGFTWQLSEVEDQAYLFCIRNGFYGMDFVNEAMDHIENAKSQNDCRKY